MVFVFNLIEISNVNFDIDYFDDRLFCVFHCSSSIRWFQQYFFYHLKSYYTAEVISNLALKWVLLIRRKSVHMLTFSLNELNFLNIVLLSVSLYWSFSAWRSLIVGVSETQSFFCNCSVLIFLKIFHGDSRWGGRNLVQKLIEGDLSFDCKCMKT